MLIIHSSNRFIISLALLGLSVSSVNAATNENIQTFDSPSFRATVNGNLTAVTGDWNFKGITDTDTLNNDGTANRGGDAAAVTLTQAQSGVSEVAVTNLNDLRVSPGRIGFSVGNPSAPWTRTHGVFADSDSFPSMLALTILQHLNSRITRSPNPLPN